MPVPVELQGLGTGLVPGPAALDVQVALDGKGGPVKDKVRRDPVLLQEADAFHAVPDVLVRGLAQDQLCAAGEGAPVQPAEGVDALWGWGEGGWDEVSEEGGREEALYVPAVMPLYSRRCTEWVTDLSRGRRPAIPMALSSSSSSSSSLWCWRCGVWGVGMGE